jgi:hypothetical protein
MHVLLACRRARINTSQGAPMKASTFRLTLAAIALVSSLFAIPTRSFADTYQLVGINIDNAPFYGFNTSEQPVLYTDNPYCGGGSTCYGHDGDWSSVAPTLATYDVTACSPSLPQGTSDLYSACINGRTAYYGNPTSNDGYDSLYVIAGSSSPQLLYQGFLTGPIYMNNLGDIVFDDGNLDEWDEAIDLTTAATPEPTPLLLLATGILAFTAFTALRRRPLLQP